MNEQMNFKRYEIKYLITQKQKDHILKSIRHHLVPDIHGKSIIQSLYFDTPDYLLVRRSMEHPLYKEKLRVRSYGVATADSLVFIELKKKFHSIVYKRRESIMLEDARNYLFFDELPKNTQIFREIAFTRKRYQNLQPVILLSYEREAFYDKDNADFRITFDENILMRDKDLSLSSGIYGTPILSSEKVLMEVKTADAIPLWLVNVLSQEHIYKTSFSKYGTAYRILYKNNGNGGIYHYA